MNKEKLFESIYREAIGRPSMGDRFNGVVDSIISGGEYYESFADKIHPFAQDLDEQGLTVMEAIEEILKDRYWRRYIKKNGISLEEMWLDLFADGKFSDSKEEPDDDEKFEEWSEKYGVPLK